MAARRDLTAEVERLAGMLRALGYPEPQTEFYFAKPRRWRFDWCWPDRRLAVEWEGGTFIGGRHTSGKGFEADLRKYNAAALAEYRVLRFTRALVADGTALAMIQLALGLVGAA